jgi:hypothetical protein
VELIETAKQSIVLVKSELGQGTGFVFIEPGIVLTAAHVVDDATDVSVITQAGDELVATVLGRDPWRDLTLLEVPGLDAEPLRAASRASLQLGVEFTKLGYGLSDSLTASTGIISAIHEETRTNPIQLQTDAAVNPGDSGAPLLTDSGKVAGVVTSKLVATDVEGIAFATLLNVSAAWKTQASEPGLICGPVPSVATEQINLYRARVFGWTVDLPLRLEWAFSTSYDVFYNIEYGTAWLGSDLYGPAWVYIELPSLATERNGKDLMNDNLASRSDEEDIRFLIQPREICHSAGVAYEAEVYAADRTPFGLVGLDSRERWITIDTGDTIYLLVAAAWPEHFEGNELLFDTVLYSFGFQ